MKRFLSVMCLAAALLLTPGRVEAGTIFVGGLDFWEGPLGPYVDVANWSDFDLTPDFDYQSGTMNSVMLTIETTGGSSQFIWGRATASGGSCATTSAADFFVAGSACVTFEPIAPGESYRFLFSAAGISVLDVLTASLVFEFDGIVGDPAIVSFGEYADLTATRPVNSAPEPASLLLLGTGAAALALRRRRQRR